MKLNDHIKALQKIQETYGNLDLIYAKDDEGNAYSEVKYLPVMVYYNSVDRDIISENDIEEYEQTEYEIVCCIN